LRPYDEAEERQFKVLRVVTWAILVVAPFIYLFVANLLRPQMPAAAGNEFVFYILLLVSLTEPGLALVVEQIQLQAFKARGRTDMKPINLFFTISLIKMAMVEVVYVFGFVVFLLTGEYLNMLFFYPIGVAWTLAFWPRRAKYEQLLEKLRQP